MDFNNKGAFTIEAAIVMSVILMILFAVMFAFMLLYQNVVINYAAYFAAQQGAEAWVNSGKSVETGEGYTKDDLYWRTKDKQIEFKKQKIEDAARAKLARGIFSPKNAQVKIIFKNYLIQRTIIVEIEQTIPFPFLGIAKYFSSDNQGMVLKGKATASVCEPTEYIRNIDLAIECIQRINNVISLDKIFKL